MDSDFTIILWSRGSFLSLFFSFESIGNSWLPLLSTRAFEAALSEFLFHFCVGTGEYALDSMRSPFTIFEPSISTFSDLKTYPKYHRNA